MSDRLFRIEILQPRFDELYLEYLEIFEEEESQTIINEVIFPDSLIKTKDFPKDIAQVCEEFNFSFSSNKPLASMLLLRRLLPLAIVRKFQILNKEDDIKQNGDYLDTKALLGKIEVYLKEKRAYTEIINYKLLVDSSQHSYTFVPTITDVSGASIKLRLFLEDIFT